MNKIPSNFLFRNVRNLFTPDLIYTVRCVGGEASTIWPAMGGRREASTIWTAMGGETRSVDHLTSHGGRREASTMWSVMRGDAKLGRVTVSLGVQLQYITTNVNKSQNRGT